MSREEPKVARQPDEAPVEELDGAGAGTDTPETAEGRSGGQEARDRALLARHLRVLASAVNVKDWPAYIRRVAAGHEAGTSWYEPVQGAPEEPEPLICRYGHTWADHEEAGACVRKPRPWWLPEQVWLGIKVGEWPVQCFPSQESAERWAAEAKWDPARQEHEHRRIWAVDIPEGTQPFKVETVPAATRLVEVTW